MAAERKIELPSHGRPTLSEQVAAHLYVALDELTADWGRIRSIKRTDAADLKCTGQV